MTGNFCISARHMVEAEDKAGNRVLLGGRDANGSTE